MNSSSSLSKYFEWNQVCRLLGLSVPAEILPAVTACPACRQPSLYLYQDRTYHSEWFHCRSCDRHGDIIELAALGWKTDPATALDRLVAEELHCSPAAKHAATVAEYLRLLAYRQKIDNFWQQSRTSVTTLSHPDLPRLYRKCGVIPHLDSGGWSRHGGRFVGAATHQEIDALRPSARAPLAIPAKDWPVAVVIPFYDLPGRLSGFLFLRQNEVQVLESFYPLYRQSGRASEAGLAGLPAILAKPTQFLDDTVFILNDPLMALRLQLRWLRSSTLPLPLVVAWQGEQIKTMAWQNVADRKCVLWAAEPTIPVLAQAAAAGAKVSSVAVADTSWKLPLEWLKYFQQHAKSWQQVLEKQLRTASQELAGTMLLGMGFRDVEYRAFLQGCDEQLRYSLHSAFAQQTSGRRVTVRGAAIIDGPRGWEIESSGEPISNVRIRIDTLLHTDRDSYYQGELQLPGQLVPFTERVARVRRHGLLACVADHLHELVPPLDPPYVFEPRWNRAAETIALRLYPPRVVTGVDRVGWNTKLRQLQFADFALAANGDLLADASALRATPALPTSQLRPPGFLLEKDLCVLAETTVEVTFFWALAALLVQNILAPMRQQSPQPIGLVGHGAKFLGEALAGDLGCLTYRVKAGHVPHMLTCLTRYNAQHAWPSILDTRELSLPVRAKFANTWIATPSGGSLLDMEWYQARVAATYGWHVLEQRVTHTPTAALRVAAEQFLPAYLQDRLRRRSQANTLTETVHDMAAWLRRALGRTFDAPGVLKYLHKVTPPTDWVPLVDLLLRLQRSRFPVPGSPKPPLRELPTQPTALWIPRQQLNTLLAQQGAPPLDAAAVSRILHAANALVDTDSYDLDHGWLVRKDWWEQNAVPRAPVTSPHQGTSP